MREFTNNGFHMIMKVGDWLIKGVSGEFYPIDNDIKKLTYDEV